MNIDAFFLSHFLAWLISCSYVFYKLEFDRNNLHFIHMDLHMKNLVRSFVVAGIAIILASPAVYAAANAKPLYSSAAAKLKSNDTQGAIADYTKAIERDPMDTYAYIRRGIIKGTIGDTLGAMTDFTKAIEIDPKNPQGYSNRGIQKEQNGAIKSAQEDYTKAIELNPKYAIAYINRGNAKTKAWNFKGAIEDYTKALELNPKSTLAINNRATAKGLHGDKEGAIEDYKKSAKLNDPDAKAWLKARALSLK